LESEIYEILSSQIRLSKGLTGKFVQQKDLRSNLKVEGPGSSPGPSFLFSKSIIASWIKLPRNGDVFCLHRDACLWGLTGFDVEICRRRDVDQRLEGKKYKTSDSKIQGSFTAFRMTTTASVDDDS
jgi:hypothetical protein